ncbi:MAG: L-histidine N(alpha)-methyltransferase [Verrucomicrobiota bacterium]
MTSPSVPVLVHPSLFPEAVHARLRASFQTRRIHGAFHYDTARRARRWMAVHAAHAPAPTTGEAVSLYDRAVAEAVARLEPRPWTCVGLGCGSGHKEARVLAALEARGLASVYIPVDVSVPLVLVAREAALGKVPGAAVRALVADLTDAADLDAALAPLHPPGEGRCVTLFGMFPNFEPGFLFGRLAGWMRPGDRLIFSANLAPGADVDAGTAAILHQYDNPETRAWLGTLLEDHGVAPGSGSVEFRIESDPGFPGCARIVADWVVAQASGLVLDGETFALEPGARVRLCVSYRHTPASMEAGARLHGLRLEASWIAASGEEGVFLAERDRAT